MIAMALINEPDILIADEPTTALDVTVHAEVLRLIKEIQANMGMAILFITHDLGVVKFVADRVLVMCKGMWWSKALLNSFSSNLSMITHAC